MNAEHFEVRAQEHIQPFGDIDSLKWLKEFLEKEKNNTGSKIE